VAPFRSRCAFRRAAHGKTLSCASPEIINVPAQAARNRIRRCLEAQGMSRTIFGISYKMVPLWRDRIRVTGTKQHFLLRLTEKQPQLSLNDVKRVLDVTVAMPRNRLSGRHLKFRDAEAGTFGVISPALYFIKMAGIFHSSH